MQTIYVGAKAIYELIRKETNDTFHFESDEQLHQELFGNNWRVRRSIKAYADWSWYDCRYNELSKAASSFFGLNAKVGFLVFTKDKSYASDNLKKCLMQVLGVSDRNIVSVLASKTGYATSAIYNAFINDSLTEDFLSKICKSLDVKILPAFSKNEQCFGNGCLFNVLADSSFEVIINTKVMDRITNWQQDTVNADLIGDLLPEEDKFLESITTEPAKPVEAKSIQELVNEGYTAHIVKKDIFTLFNEMKPNQRKFITDFAKKRAKVELSDEELILRYLMSRLINDSSVEDLIKVMAE